MALLHSTLLYITRTTWLYFTIPDCRLFPLCSTSLYLTLLYPTLFYIPRLNFTLHYRTMALLHSSLLYHESTSLYVTLLYSTLNYNDWYFTLLYSTFPYHGSTLLLITLPRFYFTLLSSTLFYHGSTSLYLNLHYSTMALLHGTLLPWLYFTLL